VTYTSVTGVAADFFDANGSVETVNSIIYVVDGVDVYVLGAATIAQVTAIDAAIGTEGTLDANLITDDASNIKTAIDANNTNLINAADLVTAFGTEGADNINLSTLTSKLHIIAGGGDDTIRGGSDNDVINAGGGADIVYGEDGNDVFRIASTDIVGDTILETTNLFGDYTRDFGLSEFDSVELSGFVLKNLSNTTEFTTSFESNVYLGGSIDLSSASLDDTTLVYNIGINTAVLNSQVSIDMAVSQIVNNASSSVFTAGVDASVLIQATSNDGDVALFHYSEAGNNGIQETELVLLGVFEDAEILYSSSNAS
jgi:hypothetical protein